MVKVRLSCYIRFKFAIIRLIYFHLHDLSFISIAHRWNKVLFLAPVPDLDDLFETDESGNTALRHSLGTIVHTKDEPFANFYPDEDGVSKKSLLFRHMRGVLKMDLIRGLGNSVRRGQNYVCFRVIFHLMDTLLQLCAYLFQIILPVFLSCVIILTIYELLSQQCVNTIL